jgi:hypothetical protein
VALERYILAPQQVSTIAQVWGDGTEYTRRVTTEPGVGKKAWDTKGTTGLKCRALGKLEMSPDRTKQPVDSLTKGLLAPDIDTLKRFFARGLKPTVNDAPTPFTRQQPAISGQLGADLIANKNLAPENPTEALDLLPAAMTPKGISCSTLQASARKPVCGRKPCAPWSNSKDFRGDSQRNRMGNLPAM